MKKSSRNRLSPQQQALFPGSSLFEKIARAVCRAGTLPRKELHEAWEMAKRVRRRYRGGRVLDLACGHGLLAHIMLILDNSSIMALAVDKEIPKNAHRLSDAIVESWPRLENKVVYKEMSIQEIQVLEGDIIVSAHACGALTDLIIEKAIEKRVRISVLPCCHDFKEPGLVSLDGWMDKSLAMDTRRVFRLESEGYLVVTQKIPNEITPKNRLLMGEYQSIKGDL